ncbi:MAG: hypothetical protein HDQ96_15510 [Lachnospiraceae bacterium]|nr:hypothetical protein [Lachnospiraceae bacterium]
MSECIICKGNDQLNDMDFSIVDASGFLTKGAFWLGGTSDIWTFKYKGKEIDDIITDAQSKMNNGIQYQDTQIYKLLNCLMDNGIHFAMWYDTYVENLDICNTRDRLLETCYKQIMDKSGMCEVYIVSNIDKS